MLLVEVGRRRGQDGLGPDRRFARGTPLNRFGASLGSKTDARPAKSLLQRAGHRARHRSDRSARVQRALPARFFGLGLASGGLASGGLASGGLASGGLASSGLNAGGFSKSRSM